MKLILNVVEKPKVSLYICSGEISMHLDNDTLEDFCTEAVPLIDIVKEYVGDVYSMGDISCFAEKGDFNTTWMREVAALLTKLADDVDAMEE